MIEYAEYVILAEGAGDPGLGNGTAIHEATGEGMNWIFDLSIDR
jgi:hypothetical protein